MRSKVVGLLRDTFSRRPRPSSTPMETETDAEGDDRPPSLRPGILRSAGGQGSSRVAEWLQRNPTAAAAASHPSAASAGAGERNREGALQEGASSLQRNASRSVKELRESFERSQSTDTEWLPLSERVKRKLAAAAARKASVAAGDLNLHYLLSFSCKFRLSLRYFDEWTGNIENCPPDCSCQWSDNLGNFLWACNDGWTGTGVSCSIDEYRANIHDCDGSATCSDSIGNFVCACNDGWTGSGVCGTSTSGRATLTTAPQTAPASGLTTSGISSGPAATGGRGRASAASPESLQTDTRLQRNPTAAAVPHSSAASAGAGEREGDGEGSHGHSPPAGESPPPAAGMRPPLLSPSLSWGRRGSSFGDPTESGPPPEVPFMLVPSALKQQTPYPTAYPTTYHREAFSDCFAGLLLVLSSASFFRRTAVLFFESHSSFWEIDFLNDIDWFGIIFALKCTFSLSLFLAMFVHGRYFGFDDWFSQLRCLFAANVRAAEIHAAALYVPSAIAFGGMEPYESRTYATGKIAFCFLGLALIICQCTVFPLLDS
uniref:EGF-like domain-containing protein n=1 Tax=Chromera velia CCMP2878 TaxID=1169474 RepID=A0A0G4F318_9ALVE|eukprot:Cvel_14990.t1-p1 / transcript=Cvel_14990.t1 / gene=Cvel_14990 / organism=Chromera_velia_CCMP2878 / gene_product=hypothetical protein / transcript_product=hypothetical protein / location=Cvel_scaffold1090:31506-38701(+) / protein_length=543 / sequence_SO=supercontig / SO=protein_coding / is_pseudo=false